MESSTLTAVEIEQPEITSEEPFVSVVKTLSVYVTAAITQPCTFEQLRTTSYGTNIRTLVDHLVINCTNPAIVNAILTLKFHFSSLEPDDRGLNDTRANACEIVAWRFIGKLSEADAVRYCLYELPDPKKDESSVETSAASSLRMHRRAERRGLSVAADEASSLLPQFRPNSEREYRDRQLSLRKRQTQDRRRQLLRSVTDHRVFEPQFDDGSDDEEDPTSAFAGLNGLEIAAVADAKKFLSQRLVQKIISGLWSGEINLWNKLSVEATKQPKFYNKHTGDPYARLRVPKYQKISEAVYFLIFLSIYYAVLIRRDPSRITAVEILLYIWLAAFAYDEFSEFIDAGLFYYADFWSTWDLAIILNGLAFFLARVIGLLTDNNDTTEIAFDILSLEALFLVPRSFSLLSLHPYFGTLIPCLKEMAKDFVKFMSVVLIIYAGFFTTFILLARDTFTIKEMSWILMKVFFGASFVGFDVMHRISPILGAPLMITFVILSNILLTTSLISLLSNSFMRVTSHAKEEYLFIYSVYVLEASTSNRLTHFYPPLNLIPLITLRPLRLILRGESGAEDLRRLRIGLLKVTHAPIVGIILAWEMLEEWWWGSPPSTFATKIGILYESTPKATAARTPQRQPFLENRARVESVLYTTPVVSRSETPEVRKRGGGVGVGGDGADSEEVGAGGAGGLDGVDLDERLGLEKKVDELSAKIQELTALIMAQNLATQGNMG